MRGSAGVLASLFEDFALVGVFVLLMQIDTLTLDFPI